MIQGTVLLTGASGLLGTWLLRTAPKDCRIVAVAHRTPIVGTEHVAADLCEHDEVVAAFASVKPSVVIHAAYAKDHASVVHATKHVAVESRKAGASLIHISTDAVFSGGGSPRHEDASPDPISDYGAWKAEAELVAASTASAAILRLPLIVSTEPADHCVDKITTAAENGDQTTWFTDEFRQPALASEVASACWKIASSGAATEGAVWHLPGPELMSRFDIASRVVSELGLDPTSIVAAETPTEVRRPKRLHLTDQRARASIGWMPSRVLAPGG